MKNNRKYIVAELVLCLQELGKLGQWPSQYLDARDPIGFFTTLANIEDHIEELKEIIQEIKEID